jgi:hypothetical protein
MMPRCNATTKKGKRCKVAALTGSTKCLFHHMVGGGYGRKATSYAQARKESKKYRRRK